MRARACVCVLGRVGLCMHIALLIQHATLMRHTVTSSVALPASTYFRRYLINGTIFEKSYLT